MRHVAYAQNFEDIVLRAPHDVEDGFYMDAGAPHPTPDPDIGRMKPRRSNPAPMERSQCRF